MNRLQVEPSVREALDQGRPVVALESSVWCQGLPQPVGYEAALEAEAIIRAEGAVPAILAVHRGRLQIGLTQDELRAMCDAGRDVVKVSLRELPLALALEQWGATTVSASLFMCQAAGIDVFSTGGIGGAHRHSLWDVSTDLKALAEHSVMVVCSGAKSLLDIPATLERLETEGVPVVGYRTDCFPVFYSRTSPYDVSVSVQSDEELVRIVATWRDMKWKGSLLVAQPVPAEAEIPAERLESLLEGAYEKASVEGVRGKYVTPFVLKYLHERTEGKSLQANRALLRENARLAARIAAKAARSR